MLYIEEDLVVGHLHDNDALASTKDSPQLAIDTELQRSKSTDLFFHTNSDKEKKKGIRNLHHDIMNIPTCLYRLHKANKKKAVSLP